jgi:hypothetical protein
MLSNPLKLIQRTQITYETTNQLLQSVFYRLILAQYLEYIYFLKPGLLRLPRINAYWTLQIFGTW